MLPIGSRFDTFRTLQSAKAVMRELQRHGLMLPVRPIRGPAPHEVAWVSADSSRVLHILHNPAYAGTVRPEAPELTTPGFWRRKA